MEWVFERRTRDGGPSGEAVPNAVEAGGWNSGEELLVREAIQNSVDAGRDGAGPVKVSFRLQQHAGDEKQVLVSTFCLDPFVERLDALAGKLPVSNVAVTQNDSEHPLRLLYIEDFNTVGLGGGLEEGNYYRLLFLIGEGSKADLNDGSGGSFGFGKGVYAHNSNLRMIFVFSVFEPTIETEGVWARLLGCAYLPAHEYDGKHWSGRVWFGIPSNDHEAQSPYPIVNDEAVSFAEKLGFAVRGASDLGTSILIVGCDSQEGALSSERLRAAAETWWWPRILREDLTVEIIEEGIRTPGIDPAGRPDLEPFIRCWTALQRGHGDEKIKLKSFNRKHSLPLGVVAVVPLFPEDNAWAALENDIGGAEASLGKAPAQRSVAYIRQPGMVVTYRTWNMYSPMSAVGVFQADRAVDQFLKLSEPMEHDRWDYHSGRLDRLAHGHDIVRAIEEGIRRHMREFLKELQPPPPPPKSGLNWLGKRLGEILAPRTSGPPPGPIGERGSVSIYTEAKPHVTSIGDGEVTLKASYAVALKQELGLAEALVSFSPRLHVLEGDNGSRGDLVRLHVRPRDGEAVASGETPNLPVKLTGTERCVIDISSDAFAADWSVAVHIAVAELSPEGE